MVNRGPANGCQRCKDRHIKCDRERPVCRQCTRLNFSCPGYGHHLDAILRDETTRVIGRYQKSNRNRNRNSRHEPSISSQKLVSKSVTAPSIPQEIACSIETHSLAFLFSIALKRDRETSHGHLDFLRSGYQQVKSDSPLAVSTSWLATLILMTETTSCHFNTNSRVEEEERRLMTKALQSIRCAIQDPVRRMETETLMAIILVAYGEYIRERGSIYGYGHDPQGRKTTMSILKIHQQGAEALIRRRGILNFQDENSLALFNAARHNAVGIAMVSGAPLAMGGGSNIKNWDLWELHEDYPLRQLCDSYTPATELDACGIRLITLQNRLVSRDSHAAGISLRQDFLDLLHRLYLWKSCVPRDWLPRRYKQLAILDGLSLVCHNHYLYSSGSVAHLFAQWYLLQIEVMHCLRELDMKSRGGPMTDIDHSRDATSIPEPYEREIEAVQDVVASEYSILGNNAQEPSEHYPVLTSTLEEEYVFSFSHITAQQCHASPLGSRFLGQILYILDMILSQALAKLNLPHPVKLFYTEVIAWVGTERKTIGSVFPVT